MPFRIGDIVTHVQLELGDERFIVESVDGNRICIRKNGDRKSWVKSTDFVLIRTEWKEHITYVMTYRNLRDNKIYSSSSDNQAHIRVTEQTILRQPESYTLLAMTKVTIPYKEPQ